MSITTTAPVALTKVTSIAPLPVGAEVKTPSGFKATRTKDGVKLLGSEYTVSYFDAQFAKTPLIYLNPPIPVGSRVEFLAGEHASHIVGRVGTVQSNTRTDVLNGKVHPYSVRIEGGGLWLATEVRLAPAPAPKPYVFEEYRVPVISRVNGNTPKGALIRLIENHEGFAKGTIFEVVRHDYDIVDAKAIDGPKKGSTVGGFHRRFERVVREPVTLVAIAGKIKTGDLVRVLPGKGLGSIQQGDVLEVTGRFGNYFDGKNLRAEKTQYDISTSRVERVARAADVVTPKVEVGTLVEVTASVGGFTKGQRVSAVTVSPGGDIKARPNAYVKEEFLYGGEYKVLPILKSEVPKPTPAKGEVEIGAYIADKAGLEVLPNGAIIRPLSPSEKNAAFVKKDGKWTYVGLGHEVTWWVNGIGLTGKSHEKAKDKGFVLVFYPGI